MNVVIWIGRLFGDASSDRSGGNSAGRCGWVSWKMCSGRMRSLRRCSPRSRSAASAGNLIAHQAGGGGGEQRLSAVSGRHQARGPVERRAVEIAAAGLGFAGVQADAHAQRVRMDLIPLGLRQGLLGLQRCGHAAVPAFEDGMHAVARGLDQAAAIGLDGLAQDLIVARQGTLHAVREGLPEPGAAFEIGEQESEWCWRGGRGHAIPIRSAGEAGGYLTCVVASIVRRSILEVVSAKRHHSCARL